jgi:putative hemolysin
MWTVELLVIAVMIAFNSVFAAFEIALASIGLGRLHALAKAKKAGAAAAVRMKEGMEASLAVVQLGITLVGATAAATGGAGAEASIEPTLMAWGLSPSLAAFLAIVLIVAPLTIVTIILGELVPKVFALRNQEWVCLRLSPPMEWFAYSVWPIVWFLENSVTLIMSWGESARSQDGEGKASESTLRELQGAAGLARMSRLIGHREEGIILSASRLRSTPLSHIMLPAEHMGMLSVEQTLSEALIVAHQEMHTRYPVTEEPGNPQRIIGYANFKDIVTALRIAPHDPSLKNLVREIRHFRADTSVADALESLIRERNHIAIIHGEGGKVVGMITLEDILEELVGEIHDEFDRVPAYVIATGNGWIVGGFVTLERLTEVTGIGLVPNSEKPLYTLNDWVTEHLDNPPRGGDEVRADGCRVLVRKTRQVLVQEAFVERVKDEPAEETAEGE